MMSRIVNVLYAGAFTLAALVGLTIMTGCGIGPSSNATSSITVPVSAPALNTIGGTVHGGQQAIVGATVTLWAAGTTGSTAAGYGANATSVATTTTGANGHFSFSNATTGASPCTTGQYLYITSVGGNSGAGTNAVAALMAAVPTPCGTSSGSQVVSVNEVSTIAAVFALQQFMSITPGGSPAWNIGAPSANVTGLANAFITAGTLAATSTGTSAATSVTSNVGGTQYTTTVSPDSAKIDTLSNLIAACINTNGGSTCTSFFADVTPGAATAPTDTIQAAYYLAAYPAGLTMNAHGNSQGSPYYLCKTYITGTPSYQPGLTCTSTSYPTDWMIGVSFTTTNPSAATVATLEPGSIAIDGAGNIWTSADNNSATGGSISALNVAGQVVVAPVTSTTISTTAGWDGSGYTGSTAYTLGGAKAYSLAIDTNNNAWGGGLYGPAVTNAGNTAATTTGTYQSPLVEVTPLGVSTGYLVGTQINALSIDGNNNIYMSDYTTTGPGGGTGRYYISELVAAGSPAYSTFYTGMDRTTGYYISTAIDESANQYVVPFYNSCNAALNRSDTAIMAQQGVNGSSNTGVSSITLSSTSSPTTCAETGAIDASNNIWGTTGSYLEYINVSSSLTAPTVTSYASGTGSTLGGLDAPSGVAIDGAGNVWVANGPSSTTGGISEFVPGSNGTTLTALSPAATGVYGFGSSYSYQKAIGAVIDPSGNVWVETAGGNYLNFLVGAAAPVVTPIAQQIKLGAIGERPQTFGTSTSPAAILSSASLTFPSTADGATSASQQITLSSSGTAALAVTSISFSGLGAADFTESNNCPVSLSPGDYCTITVAFAPLTTGSITATLNINDNAAGSPQTVSLTGTGTPTVPSSYSLTSSSLTFTAAAQSTSAAQTVTLSNTSNNVITVSSISLSGSYAANYAETNTCGTSVGVGGSCTISVTFNPYLAVSGQTATVTIASNSSSSNTISLTGTGTGTLTINTSTASGWTISTGAINLTWNSQTGNLVSVQFPGDSTQLVDTTVTSNGQPSGLYMDNTGTGTATCTASYQQMGNEYIDWWLNCPSNSSNAFTYQMHYIVTANDPGLHVYYVANHSATDIAGSLGQIQYVFRINQSVFTNTYSNNSGLNNLGVTQIALPSVAELSSSDPGRAVQNAVEDLHGFTLPSGFGREFMTKYDYSSYEYLHQEHGLYGTTYGAWTIVPKTETLSGGPTKQDLIFTENILMMESFSSHLDNELTYTPTQGVASTRLFGPYCFEFNEFNSTYTTPASLYAKAQQYLPFFYQLYDNDSTLTSDGYIASTGRGTVAPSIAAGGSSTSNTAWSVLSDSAKNFQLSSNGLQYWVNDTTSGGTATLTGVVPGTYRLSHYVLGEWGELRYDNVVVNANQTTTLPAMTFTPENFSNYAPIWTIGTPDRSAHEFLHGSNTYGSVGSCTGCDDREYYGNWNYWSDFAANSGTQVYYATAEGNTSASATTALNYVQWGTFDPGLYAGVYNSSDDTTDGYNYAIPSYVAGLSGASGINGVTTAVPAAAIHFTTTSAQQAQGTYVILSLGLSCAEGSVIATLNGSQAIYHYSNASDCMIRSGLAGYYEWGALEWPTSVLKPAGQDNVLTLGVSTGDGVMWDALRMEIGPHTANPAYTGWYDYGWGSGNSFTYQNDAVPNN